MHLNFARFRSSDSARFTHSHGTLTSWIVLTDLSKHPVVLLTWPERPKSHGENCFFQSKLQAFPDSERI